MTGKIRKQALERAKHECESCFTEEEDAGKHGLSVHHVLPEREGGDGVEENLLVLCARCHIAIHGLMVDGWQPETRMDALHGLAIGRRIETGPYVTYKTEITRGTFLTLLQKARWDKGAAWMQMNAAFQITLSERLAR